PATSRLLAIDVTRGLALLGIFSVNIQLFAEPFGTYMQPGPESSDPLTVLCYYFVKIFCEGKFYPLFSMLFGMGLALQMHSVIGRGGNFYAVYVRRLAWLFFMGLTHALLLWYGDILFVYSIAGVVLMLCVRIDPRTLLSLGVGLALFGAVLQSGFGALGAAGQQVGNPPASSPAAIADTSATGETNGAAATSGEPSPDMDAAPATPFARWVQAFRDGKIGPPNSPIWMETETEAYRHGPWSQTFYFRALSWVMFLLVCLLGIGWHVLGMFFIGAALLRMGLFTTAGEKWLPRLFFLGLVVGLPGAAVSPFLIGWAGMHAWSAALTVFLLMVCGPLVSLMYLTGIALLVRRGIARSVTNVLANVGRMALTNYLMQTVIATFVFYHWGLGQFASWSRPERCALVLGVYAVQCVISVLWMRHFRFGPMEWLWRTVTYWRAQPMQATQRL
ncbi:MAG: DUF418 domain-containing protein, partial [Bryobacteraceae bacterium]|nr:DUF418 domain-containing protein [Bryobacteraceae bacterium]